MRMLPKSLLRTGFVLSGLAQAQRLRLSGNLERSRENRPDLVVGDIANRRDRRQPPPSESPRKVTSVKMGVDIPMLPGMRFQDPRVRRASPHAPFPTLARPGIF